MNKFTKGIKPVIIDDLANDSLRPEIKEAQFMGSPSESNWFDEIPVPQDKIIDNNDKVDLENLQWCKVKEENAAAAIAKLQNQKQIQEQQRQQLQNQQQQQPLNNNMKTKEVNMEANVVSTISDIKNAIIQKRKETSQAVNNTKQPINVGIEIKEGEFAVMLRNKLADAPTTNLNRIKEVCEQIIVNVDDLKDDDIVVLMRVPLKKLFKQE